MANIRKLSAFRQLSLNCDSPKEKRNFLKKQLSEDLSEVNELMEKRSNLKNLSNNKNKTKNRPPIKIAWDVVEPSPLLQKDDEPVIVKKCKEIKRPIPTTKLTKQTINQDSILYSKQELAKRLREVFDNQDERKLNIFLTQNLQENTDFSGDTFSEISNITTNTITPKIIPPLLINHNNSNRNIFQIRKNKQELLQQPQSPKTVVVTPIKEMELSMKNDPKPIDQVIIRPSTAALKRERFQKRTNSAFNATIKDEIKIKPPLIRAVSAPISKSDKSKSKFIATKRKIKSNRKKKIKESDDDINNNTNIGVLQNLGNEVVTMVSLVSPSASDGEESSSIIQIDRMQTKSKKDDVKTKNLSLRKTIKSVSFQQSSIHAIRSFSASFPARRNSMANTFISRGKNSNNLQEKRATTDKIVDDKDDGPKRKHLKDNVEENCMNNDDNNSPKFNDNTNITINITKKTTKEEINKQNDIVDEKINNSDNDKNIKNKDDSDDIIEDNDGKIIKFGSVKEKECWAMFHKMTARGINVSYDAILRGMLTPTEYRLRNKEIVENPLGNKNDLE